MDSLKLNLKGSQEFTEGQMTCKWSKRRDAESQSHAMGPYSGGEK